MKFNPGFVVIVAWHRNESLGHPNGNGRSITRRRKFFRARALLGRCRVRCTWMERLGASWYFLPQTMDCARKWQNFGTGSILASPSYLMFHVDVLMWKDELDDEAPKHECRSILGQGESE